MTHLTPDELFRYIHGLLDDPEDALAQAHLESCARCSEQADRLHKERSVLESACRDPRPPQEEVPAMTALVASFPAAPARSRPVRLASASMGLTLAASVLGALVAGSLFLSQQSPSAPPAQERPAGPESEEMRLRRLAREFLGDDNARRMAAKAELLKTGPTAIRILLEERQGKPAEVFHRASDLLLTLRFQGESSSEGREFRMRMSATTLHEKEQREDELFDLLCGFPVLAETNGNLTLPSPEVCQSLPDYRVLDLMFDAAGLDYAFRFGLLIVAKPEDLWPFPEPERGRPQEEALKRLMARLDSAVLTERDEAERSILRMGTWVAEPLREETKSGSPEYQARVGRILATIERRLSPPRFAPMCALDRQLLSPEGEKLRARLISRSAIVTMGNFAGDRLDVALLEAEELKGEQMDMQRTMPPVKCSDLLADVPLDRRIVSSGRPVITMRDLLVLLTRMVPGADLDFCVVDGPELHVRVDTRAEIAKIVDSQNKAREADRPAPGAEPK